MNLVDKLICEIDKGLKFSMDNYQKQSRDYPAKDLPEDNLNETKESFRKLNESKSFREVAAQGLYRGQALTARLEGTRDKMDRAAQEELDHLSWCNKRLDELNERPSYLSPLWYGLSFGMGLLRCCG